MHNHRPLKGFCPFLLPPEDPPGGHSRVWSSFGTSRELHGPPVSTTEVCVAEMTSVARQHHNRRNSCRMDKGFKLDFFKTTTQKCSKSAPKASDERSQFFGPNAADTLRPTFPFRAKLCFADPCSKHAWGTRGKRVDIRLPVASAKLLRQARDFTRSSARRPCGNSAPEATSGSTPTSMKI